MSWSVIVIGICGVTENNYLELAEKKEGREEGWKEGREKENPLGSQIGCM